MLFCLPYLCVLELSNTKISLHLLKQHTSESSLNWHGLTWIGGTFESDTGGTFHSDMPGTFQSAADGTFVSAIDGTFQSDMSGTFGPLLSSDFKMTSDTHRNEYVWNKTMYFCLAIRNGLIASGWSPIHLDAHIVLRQTRLPGQSM